MKRKGQRETLFTVRSVVVRNKVFKPDGFGSLHLVAHFHFVVKQPVRHLVLRTCEDDSESPLIGILCYNTFRINR
jgi:hypothetical protein